MMYQAASTGLPKDWVLAPSIDLELKRYTLLGYLQRVERHFTAKRLYPHLPLLDERVEELVDLQRSKAEWARSLAGPVIAYDPATGNPVRERPVETELMRVIDEVVELAIPGLKEVRTVGHGRREELARNVHLNAVGVLPIHAGEGWLLLGCRSEVRTYSYTCSLVQEVRHERRHQNVTTRFVRIYTSSLGNSYDRIKEDLIRSHPHMPNPATFAAESDVELPCLETFLPLVKRRLHDRLIGLAA